jgi:hypothetical protein
MLCCATRRDATLCYATICYATLRCAVLCCAVLCYAMLRYALCHVAAGGRTGGRRRRGAGVSADRLARGIGRPRSLHVGSCHNTSDAESDLGFHYSRGWHGGWSSLFSVFTCSERQFSRCS